MQTSVVLALFVRAKSEPLTLRPLKRSLTIPCTKKNLPKIYNNLSTNAGRSKIHTAAYNWKAFHSLHT